MRHEGAGYQRVQVLPGKLTVHPGTGPRDSDSGQAGDRADIRGGLGAEHLRLSSKAQRNRCDQRGSQATQRGLCRCGGRGPVEIFRCARQSPALPAGEIPVPARSEPLHRGPSLGLMEVTTWVKRRQGDTRAVTQVKPNESRDNRPEADTLEYVEGQAKVAASGQAAGGSGGV